MNVLRDNNNNHCTNDASKLEEDYQNSLKSLQKKKNIAEKSTEISSTKSRVIAQMEEKEMIHKNLRRKIQVP